MARLECSEKKKKYSGLAREKLNLGLARLEANEINLCLCNASTVIVYGQKASTPTDFFN